MYYISQREGHAILHRAMSGTGPVWLGGRGRSKWKAWLRVYTVFCKKAEWARETAQAGGGSMSVGSGLWVWSLVVWYLALGDSEQGKVWLCV